MSLKLLWFVSSQSNLGFLHHGNRSLPCPNLLFQHRAGKGKNQRWKPHFCSSRTYVPGSEGLRRSKVKVTVVSTMAATSSAGEIAMSSEEKVYNVVLKQAALVNKQLRSPRVDVVVPGDLSLLNEAYDRCGEICAEYAKTFYLGTLLMTPERRRAIWAIYVWCRRTDELVDGPNAPHITPTALDRWESRLEDLFNGRPFDMLDAALANTVNKFPVDIQPFKDMIEGMRMDLRKSRYKNFDELYLYCYYVAGTVGLMSVPVMGIAPESLASTESVYNAALALGIANQLTNILRDVGEDAQRGKNLHNQEHRLDGQIRKMQERLRDLSEDENNSKWLFVTEEDIKSLPCFQNEMLIAIKAPHGTTLEVPDPDEDDDSLQRRYRLVLRSSMGPIDVYLVSQIEEKFEEVQGVGLPSNLPSTSGLDENPAEVETQGQYINGMCLDHHVSQDFVSGIMKFVPSNLDNDADYWLLSDPSVSITNIWRTESGIELNNFDILQYTGMAAGSTTQPQTPPLNAAEVPPPGNSTGR